MQIKRLFTTRLPLAALVLGCDQGPTTSGKMEQVSASGQAALPKQPDYTYARRAEFKVKMQSQVGSSPTIGGKSVSNGNIRADQSITMGTGAIPTTGVLRRAVLHKFTSLGGAVWQQWHELLHTAAVIGTVLVEGIRPRNWTRAGRTSFSRQVLALGIEPLGFIAAVAGFVGISVVVQLSFWAGEAGQSRLLGPLLVAVVARELGPLLINLVVIVRSGGAMTTELGQLQNQGAITRLEARGGDPLRQLVLPRVLGMAAATFSLTIVFTFAALASGFFFAAWMGKGGRDVLLFADNVFGAIQPKDIYNILAKSILPALFASATCCVVGLGTGGSLAELPAATQRALARSIMGLLIISAVVSLLTYLRA